MPGAMASRIGSIRANLVRLDRQPLGKAALTIVLLLDIFILSSLFDGLDKHTAQLAAPDQFIPATCRDIVLDGRWNRSNRLERLSTLVAAERTSYAPPSPTRSPVRHPVCESLLGPIDAITKDPELGQTFIALRKQRQEAADLRGQIERLKGAYDTALLETVARQRDGQAHVDALRDDLHGRTEALNALARTIADLEAAAERNERVRGLWAQIDRLSESDREQLRTDLQKFNFWYPVRRLGMEMLFLLPLFALFYLWNSASIRKDRPVQTLVSSHLLVIAVIPLLFKVIQTVYDILPKKFLRRLVELLEALNLIALWYYLAMALAIVASLAVIYIVQKKIFSRKKLLEKRIAHGLCQECGRRLPPGSRACPLCGFAQFKTCGHCGEATHVYGGYCRECGKPVA